MPRVKLLHAMAFDEASWQDSGVADPMLRVRGELPGKALPFVVHRVYQGPQGHYQERFLLLDDENVVVHEQPYRLIELRGEMFEDRFRTRVADVTVERPQDHRLVFVLDDVEVGRVPVFIDAPDSASAAGVLDEAVAAALKKGDIVWLSIPQGDGRHVSRPAWFISRSGRIFVLTGPGEQQLDGIDDADEVEVTVKSKDVKAAIATVTAAVERIEPDDEAYEEIARTAVGKRLNLGESYDAALARWRETCRLYALTPQV